MSKSLFKKKTWFSYYPNTEVIKYPVIYYPNTEVSVSNSCWAKIEKPSRIAGFNPSQPCDMSRDATLVIWVLLQMWQNQDTLLVKMTRIGEPQNLSSKPCI